MSQCQTLKLQHMRYVLCQSCMLTRCLCCPVPAHNCPIQWYCIVIYFNLFYTLRILVLAIVAPSPNHFLVVSVNFFPNRDTLTWYFVSSASLFESLRTRCSAIAERPRCRVRYSFGQKWKTRNGRQYFTDIIGLSSTTVI